jgi:hypothetical protein
MGGVRYCLLGKFPHGLAGILQVLIGGRSLLEVLSIIVLFFRHGQEI